MPLITREKSQVVHVAMGPFAPVCGAENATGVPWRIVAVDVPTRKTLCKPCMRRVAELLATIGRVYPGTVIPLT